MNKQMTSGLTGTVSVTLKVAAIAFVMGTTVSQAQSYSDNYYQQGGQENYKGEYQQQASYQPHTRGRYYSQHYRPRALPMPEAKAKSPVDLLEESINQVIDFLSQPQEVSLDQINFFLKKEITPHFDFNYMSRWVAGRYYRTMSPEQRAQFKETFVELFITTFVKKMSNYQNYPPVVGDFKSRRTSDDEATATAKVYQESGGSIQVDFKFMKTKSGWKVIDVRANGVSALLYYRNHFAEKIRRREQHRAVFN